MRFENARHAAWWLFATLLLCVATSVKAHDVPPSLVLLDIGHETVDIELQLPLTELGTAVSQPLAIEPTRAIREHEAGIRRYVLEHLRLTAATGAPFTGRVESLSLKQTNNPNWVSNDWLVMRLRMRRPPGADTERFALDYDVILQPVVTHKALVYVRRDIRNGLLGETPQAIGLIAFQQTHLALDGSDGSWWQGFVKLWHLGASHIAEGTDHLLFLLVLLLPAPLVVSARRWQTVRSVKDSVWMVAKTASGFTIGHSITLALGSLGVIAAPERPIEVLIAISIIISAVHAWRPLFSGKEIYLAAGFGLIHGLAFATTLAGLDFDSWTLGLSLLGFNLGIESMQLAMIACVMPWLLMLSRTRMYSVVRLAGAGVGALAAFAWTLERVSGQPNAMAGAIASASQHPGWMIALLTTTALVATGIQRWSTAGLPASQKLGPSSSS